MLRLDLKISWLEFVVMVMCHLLAFASLFYLDAVLAVQIVLILLVLISFRAQFNRILQRSGSSVLQAHIGHNSSILVTPGGRLKAVFTGAVYVSQPLTLLEFRLEKSLRGKGLVKRTRMLVALPIDAVSRSQRKDLHGFLKHSFNPSKV